MKTIDQAVGPQLTALNKRNFFNFQLGSMWSVNLEEVCNGCHEGNNIFKSNRD